MYQTMRRMNKSVSRYTPSSAPHHRMGQAAHVLPTVAAPRFTSPERVWEVLHCLQYMHHTIHTNRPQSYQLSPGDNWYD